MAQSHCSTFLDHSNLIIFLPKLIAIEKILFGTTGSNKTILKKRAMILKSLISMFREWKEHKTT